MNEEEIQEETTQETTVVNVEVVNPEVLSYMTYALDETATGDAGTMAEVITSVFGEYHAKTQTVTEISSDGTVVSYTEYVPGLAGLDYHWISGVLLFAIVLTGIFKLLGGLFRS